MVRYARDGDGFSIKANFTRTETDDVVLMDFIVHNNSRFGYTLNAFGDADVYINEVLTDISGGVDLDVGLYRIVAKTGDSTNMDFRGLKLTK